ncbi:MAG: bifunctional oligoribonuclease/PAP phosphatase NrnA [Bacteroidetes bacterium]|nr:bifunctional oligoribonuclease/PAP phosphatase NrnA [Bacteroidota bacterium]
MSNYKFNQEDKKAIIELLSSPKEVVITTHHKPDGDALGSSLGLMHILKALGHQVKVVVPSEFPAFLNWMNGSKDVVDFIKNPKSAKDHLSKAEVVFCLDFNNPSRVEKMQVELLNVKVPMVLIDHHLDPKAGFCNFQFSYPSMGSTAELIVHLLMDVGWDQYLHRDSAECLYTGIMTDTGSFRFNSVTDQTHLVISRLMKEGVRNDRIHELIYDTNSFMRMKFLGYTLNEKMQMLSEYNVIVFTASQSDMDRFEHEPGDLEGIVNFGLSIKNIKVAVLFSERDGLVKISFRSKGTFSVKDIAEKYFEGGGHRNAAGGRSKLKLAETVKKFIDILPLYKTELQSEISND